MKINYIKKKSFFNLIKIIRKIKKNIKIVIFKCKSVTSRNNIKVRVATPHFTIIT